VNQRGHGYGTVLAHSFLHYAPALGYQASVFNLVYVNNTASVRCVVLFLAIPPEQPNQQVSRLWEALDFQKAGRIPRAGRLRRQDGNGEEYVDAWIFYKSFVQPEGAAVNA
jgi:ribosomal protein S18 acetylase RimI-like enzyme